MFATRSEKRPYYLSFWMFVWGEIASKSLKNPLEIVITICSIFRQIFLWFWVDFGPSGRPLGVAGDGQRTVFFLSGIALEPKMAPRPRPRASGTPPTHDFFKIFNRIRLRFFIVRWFRHGGGKAEGNWIYHIYTNMQSRE